MNTSVPELDLRFIVFLKDESLWVEECVPAEVFAAAKRHDAGICGVFAESGHAQEFLVRLKTEQQRLWQRRDPQPMR